MFKRLIMIIFYYVIQHIKFNPMKKNTRFRNQLKLEYINN